MHMHGCCNWVAKLPQLARSYPDPVAVEIRRFTSLFLSTLMHLLHLKKVEKTYGLSYVFWDRVRARNSA